MYFLIDFLDELGNFKQQNFTLQNVNFSFTFYNNGPNIIIQHDHKSNRLVMPHVLQNFKVISSFDDY